MLKTILKKIINTFGFDLVKLKNADNMQAGIIRAKNHWGVQPKTIFDVGAAEGKWSLKTQEVFTNSNYVLFEPLPQRKAVLDQVISQNSNFSLVQKGAGEQNGQVSFFVTNDLDGSGIADNGTNAEKITIDITSLDATTAELQLQAPFLIKLDTHGYELPILKGAENTLAQTEMLIIECYGQYIAPDSLLFHELCAYLHTKGFRLADIVDTERRFSDKTFWQCDAFFLRQEHAVFQKNTYN